MPLVIDGNRVFLTLPGARPHTVEMAFESTNPAAQAQGEEPLASVSSELAGNDPSRWRHNIPHFGRVRIAGLYPGVDAIFYGDGRQLEFDLELSPGASAADVAIRYSGAAARIKSDGDAEISWAGGALLTQHAPKVYQRSAHGEEAVSCRYLLDSTGAVRFALGPHDSHRPLIIDPVISYGSLLGGVATELGSAIAVDASGNMYIAYSLFPLFDGNGSLPLTPHVPASGTGSLFLEKYTAAGALVWVTRFGGDNVTCTYNELPYPCYDSIKTMVVDPQGQVAIEGYARNANFPLKNALFSSITLASGIAPFVCKFNASGSDFLFSTFFGALNGLGQVDSSLGTMYTVGTDSAGNTYVAGDVTAANSLILTPNNFMNLSNLPTSTGQYAFAAKFDDTGGLAYSVLIGTTGKPGGGNCNGESTVVDSAGNLYMSGSQCHALEVTSGVLQSTFSDYGGFIAKLNPAGTDMVYATYMVGLYNTVSMAVDSSGAVYILGTESKANGFATTPGAFKPTFQGDGGPAAVKLNPAGSARVFATYIGIDGGGESLPKVFVDNQSKPWLVYTTTLTSEVIVDAPYSRAWIARLTQYDPVIYQMRGTYVARLATDASAIEVGTFVNSTPPGSNSSPYYDYAAMDPQGNLFITGTTDMLPVLTPNAYQSTYGGGEADLYIVEIEDVVSPTSCTYAVTPGSTSYPFTGGDLTVTITPTPISGGCQWNLAGLPSWIQPWPMSAPGTAGTGIGIMEFSLLQNGSTLRTAMLSVAGASIPVSQVGIVPCTTHLTNSGASAAHDGETTLSAAFTVSPASCGWLATTASPWISITSTPVGTGSSSVGFSVAANSAVFPRIGAIMINDQAFAVMQNGLPAVLSIAKSHQGVLFVDEADATYMAVVSNQAGAGPTSGQVTVTETLPADLNLLSMSGDGWSCPDGGLVCTRSDALNGGASYPAIFVKAHIAASAALQQTNHVAVSGGGSGAAGADDAADISPLTCNVNSDPVTDVVDVRAVLSEMLGITAAVHDLNHDGAVNLADVQKVINAANGLGCS